MSTLFKHNALTALNRNVWDGYAEYVSRDRCTHMVDTPRAVRLSAKRRKQVDMRMRRGVLGSEVNNGLD